MNNFIEIILYRCMFSNHHKKRNSSKMLKAARQNPTNTQTVCIQELIFTALIGRVIIVLYVSPTT